MDTKWKDVFFKACVCYFSLFSKEQCVSWLLQTKYFEKKFNFSCFIFPLFHEHLFSPGLPRATRLLETSCFEKITVYVIKTILVTLPLVQMNKAWREVSQQSSTNQDKIATVLRTHLNDWFFVNQVLNISSIIYIYIYIYIYIVKRYKQNLLETFCIVTIFR